MIPLLTPLFGMNSAEVAIICPDFFLIGLIGLINVFFWCLDFNNGLNELKQLSRTPAKIRNGQHILEITKQVTLYQTRKISEGIVS